MGVSPNIAKLHRLDRQIVFAAAQALTETVQELRTVLPAAYRRNFTIRNAFLERGPLALKIKFATKNNLSAEISSGADFLALQETGGVKRARRANLAIPTQNVRRTKRDIIRQAERPKSLSDAFVIKTRQGPYLVARRSAASLKRRPSKARGERFKGLVFFYKLQPDANIQARPTFFPSAIAFAQENFDQIFAEKLQRAIATAR
jgi:hypothetical protein